MFNPLVNKQLKNQNFLEIYINPQIKNDQISESPFRSKIRKWKERKQTSGLLKFDWSNNSWSHVIMILKCRSENTTKTREDRRKKHLNTTVSRLNFSSHSFFVGGSHLNQVFNLCNRSTHPQSFFSFVLSYDVLVLLCFVYTWCLQRLGVGNVLYVESSNGRFFLWYLPLDFCFGYPTVIRSRF